MITLKRSRRSFTLIVVYMPTVIYAIRQAPSPSVNDLFIKARLAEQFYKLTENEIKSSLYYIFITLNLTEKEKKIFFNSVFYVLKIHERDIHLSPS